jgi:3-oxoacyl-[acyl-carrier-protein] synthase II
LERVWVTGIGVVSPYGVGRELYWQHLIAGQSAAKPITSFDASLMPTRFWANAPESDTELQALLENRRSGKLLSRCGKMAIIAAAEAFEQANFGGHRPEAHRLGVSVGAGGIGLSDADTAPISYHTSAWLKEKPDASLSEGEFWQYLLENMHPLNPVRSTPNAIAAHLAIHYQAMGSSLTYTTACTSSAQAIGEAMLKIRFGLQDVMIAGGADSNTNPSGLLSFSLLGTLSKNNDNLTKASRPFDRDRDGFLLSEGATFLILESESFCRARGGMPLAELAGYGTAADAYRVTDEPEDARGAIMAMKLALEDANMQPEELDHINAHGTSTRMNDPIETFAIRQVFGSAADRIPVSANKSMIGHLVAGAGAIELAAAVMTLGDQRLPPTINLEHPDPACDLDYVKEGARPGVVRSVLSNSFGFGGQNACLIVKKII